MTKSDRDTSKIDDVRKLTSAYYYAEVKRFVRFRPAGRWGRFTFGHSIALLDVVLCSG